MFTTTRDLCDMRDKTGLLRRARANLFGSLARIRFLNDELVIGFRAQPLGLKFEPTGRTEGAFESGAHSDDDRYVRLATFATCARAQFSKRRATSYEQRAPAALELRAYVRATSTPRSLARDPLRRRKVHVGDAMCASESHPTSGETKQTVRTIEAAR